MPEILKPHAGLVLPDSVEIKYTITLNKTTMQSSMISTEPVNRLVTVNILLQHALVMLNQQIAEDNSKQSKGVVNAT